MRVDYRVGLAALLVAATVTGAQAKTHHHPSAKAAAKSAMPDGDWRTINQADYANREAEGIFYEPKAGERLYHLRHKPKWAGGA